MSPLEVTLLHLAWAWPLGLAGLAWLRPFRVLAVTAPVPALLAAGLAPIDVTTSLEWVLLETELGLDATGRGFLAFSALVWLAAALYGHGTLRGDPRAGGFWVFFLLAASGNLLAVVSQDMVTFFLGYAQMGVATYGLVVHDGGAEARRAGRVYLSWTMLGEVLVFTALVVLGYHGGGLSFGEVELSDPTDPALGLLLLGMGIKVALPGLHTWVPLAYPAAPAAAAAAMSGAMIHVGLLGWLRLVPLEAGPFPDWGTVFLVAGLTGMAYGVAVGLVQVRPRVVLAYSSISQLGVMTTGVGVTLVEPGLGEAAVAALTVYAAHHALAKGALFLGTDLLERGQPRRWVLPGLALTALALAGAPFTSGATAKAALAPLADGVGKPWGDLLAAAFAFSATITTLLMARYLYLASRVVAPGERSSPLPLLAYALALAGSAALPWAVDLPSDAGLAPVVAGGFVAALVLLARPEPLCWMVGRIPPGDIAAVVRLLPRPGRRATPPSRPPPGERRRLGLPGPDEVDTLAARLGSWPVAGLLWVGLVTALAVAALSG